MTFDALIEHFELLPHPEGGYFKEVYRSTEVIPNTVLGNEFEGDRNVATGIYFLLSSEHHSAFHKIKQDETWHFYKGSGLLLHIISSEGRYSLVKIGNNFDRGEIPQYVVSAGNWFAAEVSQENTYAFVGCTVAPGFDFRDFTMPAHTELVNLFPEHQAIIKRLGYRPKTKN